MRMPGTALHTLADNPWGINLEGESTIVIQCRSGVQGTEFPKYRHDQLPWYIVAYQHAGSAMTGYSQISSCSGLNKKQKFGQHGQQRVH